MDFQDIFNEFYALFRGDNAVPPVTDPEWAIAVRFGNTALRRLENVDAEDWEWLWTTAIDEDNQLAWPTGTSTLNTFDGPTNMKKPGGWIKFIDPVHGGSFRVDVIDNYNVQRQTDNSTYAFWTGGAQTGWTLNISLSGNTYAGWTIDFPYYKFITQFDATTGVNAGVNEDGTTVTECPDPNFIINYILAYRFRATRNYPSYQTAKADAELALKGMQQKNRTGVDGHPWNLNDTSSGHFGVGGGSGFGI